jgi:hypothetical protein
MQVEAQTWMEKVRPLVSDSNCDQRFVINMDQTPIFFCMLPRTTLERIGSRTVNVRTPTASTLRVTVAVTITANGDMLPPLFVFKGKPGGRISREFTGYPSGGVYTVQDSAWMDESIMLIWIDQILIPYVATRPVGVEPVLILDAYRCHMMSSIVKKIEEAGVRLAHIPGGCTSVCQPVDVEIGKPLKCRVRDKLSMWMTEQGSESCPVRFTPPNRSTVADWVITSLQDLPGSLIKNS